MKFLHYRSKVGLDGTLSLTKKEKLNRGILLSSSSPFGKSRQIFAMRVTLNIKPVIRAPGERPLAFDVFKVDGSFCELALLVNIDADLGYELLIPFGVEPAINPSPHLFEKPSTKRLINRSTHHEWGLGKCSAIESDLRFTHLTVRSSRSFIFLRNNSTLPSSRPIENLYNSERSPSRRCNISSNFGSSQTFLTPNKSLACLSGRSRKNSLQDC